MMGRNRILIASPLAKYDSQGNIFCVICKNLIKSTAIWKVHINSKLHKTNVEEAKQVNKELLRKQLKKTNKLHNSQTSKQVKNIYPVNNIKVQTIKELNKYSKDAVMQKNINFLPKMFFDDPVVDAKIRHEEYTHTEDDEWERFQREIKEESLTSNKLLCGEQLISAVDRELYEISEQMRQWSKVIKLENKLQNITKTDKRNIRIQEKDDEISDVDDIDENLDWRSKKFL